MKFPEIVSEAQPAINAETRPVVMASGNGGTVNTGIPDFTIPPFAQAISPIVDPKISVCSRPNFVMVHMLGWWRMLV